MSNAIEGSEQACQVRPQFGNRFITDKELIFSHNAWDNVQWDSEQEENAAVKVKENSLKKVSDSQREIFEKDASKYWDSFYDIHENKFFKDRHWLLTEFPELDSSEELLSASDDKVKMLEVGCGVGNTLFPLLQKIPNSHLFVYCCDFSTSAIEILKANSLYDESRCSAFVCDVTSDDWNPPFEQNSLDFVSLIFVLSTINPERFSHVVKKLSKYLKPGGLVLFRDYGQYDLVQLRFRDGQCLSENFYVRGDGTRVYFFTQDIVRELFLKEGFIEVQNVIDRRLQVNRGKLLKMYRVWIQAKYRKPIKE